MASSRRNRGDHQFRRPTFRGRPVSTWVWVLLTALFLVSVWYVQGNVSDRGGLGHAAGDTAVFEHAIDGDTIETSEGRVRLIGIDTPERGDCGYEDARDVVWDLFRKGDPVVLVAPLGQNGEDRYGRLLRYVETVDGVDLGSVQLDRGYAVARYDSVDGYPFHPREIDYRNGQKARLDRDRNVVATECEP